MEAVNTLAANPVPQKCTLQPDLDAFISREKRFTSLQSLSTARRNNIVPVQATLNGLGVSFCRSSFSQPLTVSSRLRPVEVRAAKKTFSSFDELLNNTETALLVDFYATWCGPCQFMVPVLDDVGRALKDKLRIVKIDSEKYPNIASRYGVQALPTLILFHNGQPIDRLEGAIPGPELIKRIKAMLSASKAKA